MSNPTTMISPASLGQATSIEEGEKHLELISRMVREGKMSAARALGIKATTLRLMHRMAADQPERSARALLEELLPLGLGEDEDSKNDIELHLCRELAGEWINDLAAAGWGQIVEQALDYLNEQLRGPKVKTACWSLAQIGLRHNSVLEVLENILRAEAGEPGDYALSAIIDLGVPVNRVADYRVELERRIHIRVNNPLLYCLQEIGDEHTLRRVFRSLPRSGEVSRIDPAITKLVWVLAKVVARDPEPHLQDLAVRIHKLIERDHPQSIGNTFHIGSQVLPGCDSPQAVELLLALLGRWKVRDAGAAHKHWLLFLRLQDCVKPRQLEAIRLPKLAREVIENYLFSPDSAETNVQPFSADVKSGALDAAFRLALPGLDNRLEDIVTAASDPFTREQIMTRFQALVLPELPDFLKSLVVEQIDIDTTKQGDVGWFQRVAATHLIANSPSWETLEVLGNPGLLVDGEVLQPTAEALGEVALVLSIEPADRERVCGWLLDSLEGKPLKPKTYALCYTLAMVVSASRFPAALSSRLARWCADAGLEDYPRSELIRALGFLRAEDVVEEVRRLLLDLAAGPDHWLCWRALISLARLDILIAHPGLLEGQLGLRPSSQGWDWSGDHPQVSESARIIGLLCVRHPDEFVPAMAALVERGEWRQWNYIGTALDEFIKQHQILPAPVADALIARIKGHQTSYSSDPSLFAQAARWMPERLVREPWDKCWDNWLADARTHLATALGSGKIGGDALRLLTRLANDEHFGVRRAASRVLGRSVPALLLDRCASQVHQDIRARVRAAEKLCWIPQEQRCKTWTALASSLSTDRSSLVRGAMATANGEDIQRGWARQYCQIVIRLTDRENSAVLAAWRYGEALVRVGDDETLEQLAEHLRITPLPVNVRHWKVAIVKALEKSWEERKKKKKVYCSPFQQCLETGIGTLRAPDGEGAWAVSYNVRSEPEFITQSTGSREGTLRAVTEKWHESLSSQDVCLILEDGRMIPGVLRDIRPGSFAVFEGHGAVPSADVDSPAGH